MTLQSSGLIAISQINSELGASATRQIWMDHGDLRRLANVNTPQSRIAMSDFFGRSNYTPMSYTPINVNDERVVPAGSNSYAGAWYPSVNVSGGSGGYTYSWAMADNPGGFTLLDTTNQSCRITHTVGRFGFNGSCTLICYINDNTGHQVSLYVTAYINITTDA